MYSTCIEYMYYDFMRMTETNFIDVNVVLNKNLFQMSLRTVHIRLSLVLRYNVRIRIYDQYNIRSRVKAL